MNVGYMLTRSARYYPDRTAFVVNGVSTTFAESNRRVNQLANGLLSLGLKKGDRVGLLFNNSNWYLESYLALYKAGLVWVRLNARLSTRELQEMVEDAGMTVLIHGPEFAKKANEISAALQWIIKIGDGPGLDYEKLLAKSSPKDPPADVNTDDICDLWYTSGTTGKPKGIILTHRNILTCMQLLLTDVYDINMEDKFLTAGALSHAASVRILPFIVRGATCYLHSHYHPVNFFQEIEQSRITDIAVVPTMLIGLLDSPERKSYDLTSIKRITYAGSPMPVNRIKEALEQFGPVLDQSYGQAESIITITHLSREDHMVKGDPLHEKRLASTGREYPGVQVKIIDDNDKELKPGEIGEVVTRSDLVMRGYWNRPDKTKEAIKGGWLHTGDIGYLDEEGYLFLVDRMHDKIITGGLNVYPREVEEVMATHKAISQVCVFGVKDDYWGEAITAAVVLKEGMSLIEDELMAWCREKLAGYKRPKRIYFMDDLPKNPYGKVMRKELKKLFPRI
ncbi:class I adenylate-forming enzyme family protein [Thermodesulfobacteriota bacterium]